VDFIAAFSFNVLINDCAFIEKYSRIILDLEQSSMINLRGSSHIDPCSFRGEIGDVLGLKLNKEKIHLFDSELKASLLRSK